MKNLRTIVIEDEPLAAELMAEYIVAAPALELAGVYPNALLAMTAMQSETVDVAFVDIHLPKLKGIAFVRALVHRPLIVFTTAYKDYAAESFDLEVVDYLLKPIEFDRFLRAAHRVIARTSRVSDAITYPMTKNDDFSFLRVGRKRVRVHWKDVVYIESQGAYVRLILDDGRVLTTQSNIRDLARVVAPFGFIRVHRSFIVSLPHVTAYTGHDLELGDHTIPIGRHFREVVKVQLAEASGTVLDG